MADRRAKKKPKPKSFGKRPSSGPTQAQPSTSRDTETVQTEDPEASLERELAWCIQKLQQGLVAEKQDSRRVQDAMKILRVLQNPNAPLVKKRQLMRNTFGDYRKKMQEEERQFSANARRVTLQTAESKLINQATFYRKAVGNPATKDVESSQSNCSLQSTVSNEPFKFNFSAAGSGDPLVANTDTNKQCTDSNTVVDKCNIAPQQVAADGVSDISATVSAMNINHNSQETALSNPCLNYYKMETTGGQGFSFNFTNPNET